MDPAFGADVLDSTHAFTDFPEPTSHTDEWEEPTPSVHPNFNFELVVFRAGDTLFKVIKNGFQVPGTVFEAMFALPPGGEVPVEGTTIETPIVLEGIDEQHFDAFLRVLYPFMGQPTVVKHEEWVGILQLATMWEFKEIREKAIVALSLLNPQRELTERIFLGARYGIADWLRDGYTEMVQRPALKIEDLLGSPFPLNWETIAKLFYARDSLLPGNYNYSCCGGTHGPSYPGYARHCRCRTIAVVDQVFKADFETMRDNPKLSDPPLPTSSEEQPQAESSGKKKKKKK